jgi:hypothetical protein
MNMKKTRDEDVNQNILQLVLTSARCDLKIRDNYDNSALFYMMLILCHPKVAEDIALVRKKLNLDLLSYPCEGSIGDKISLPWHYGLEGYQNIAKKTLELMTKYNLGDNWQDVLMVYLVSDVLPVPMSSKGIELRPYNEGPSGLVGMRSFGSHLMLNDNEENGADIISYYQQLLKYPRIQITERLTSKNQLKNWIDENWDEKIQPQLKKMPSKIKPAASIERLALGLWLRELKEVRKLSWDQIEKQIDSIEDDNLDFFGVDESRMTPDRAKGPDLIYSAKSALAEFYPL